MAPSKPSQQTPTLTRFPFVRAGFPGAAVASRDRGTVTSVRLTTPCTAALTGAGSSGRWLVVDKPMGSGATTVDRRVVVASLMSNRIGADATSTRNLPRAIVGMASLIGIEEGVVFEPDDSVRQLLLEAEEVGAAMASTLPFASDPPREQGMTTANGSTASSPTPRRLTPNRVLNSMNDLPSHIRP